MTVDEVVARIVAGEYDESMDRLTETIIFRSKQIRKDRDARNLATLAQGDLVVMTDEINPQYLRGLTAEVVEEPKLGRKLAVKFQDARRARRYGHGTIKVPADLVRKAS